VIVGGGAAGVTLEEADDALEVPAPFDAVALNV
jgi:hypothetical protein